MISKVPLNVWLNDMAQPLSCNPQETLLEVLERLGYRMRRSCRNGVCEICEFTLLKGQVSQSYPAQELCVEPLDPQSRICGLACTAVPVTDIWVNIDGLKRPGEVILKRLVCDVERVEKLSGDVYCVTLLAPPTASQAVEFHAGQYLEIVLPDERKAAFSIGSAPEAGREIELHIRQVAGSDVASAIIEQIKTSAQITVEMPKGDCFLQAATLAPEQTVILAAASTGFSQIKSMVEHLIAANVTNPIHIYWGARIAADLYWPELPLEWASKHDNIVYHPVVSEPGDSCGWTGRIDLLPDAIKTDFDSFEDTVVYASGSPAMVYALVDNLAEKGLQETQVHSDVFAYAPRPAKS